MKKQLIFLFLTAILVWGCESTGPELPSKASGKIKFALNLKNQIGDDGRTAELTEPASILFNLTTETGETVSGSSEIYKMGESYFTVPFSLATGEYLLQEFLILDDGGNTIYLAPLADSPLAEYVANPLPFQLVISVDKTSEVPVHVFATGDHQPADFGYSEFRYLPLHLRTIPVLASRVQEMALDEFSYYIDVTARDTVTQAVWSKTYEMTNPDHITIPVGYHQYRLTAYADGYMPQVKYFRADFPYDNIATIESLTFELIPEGSDQVIVLENEGFKFYISADPCALWGRVEMPEEFAFRVEYIRFFEIALNGQGAYAGQLYPGGGLIGFPAVMSNFDNIFDWGGSFYSAESYCEQYINEDYRNDHSQLTFEKGLLLDFDWQGTETTLEDYDVHLIHQYDKQ